MKYATRRSNFFDPKSDKPFALSRSKIQLFLDCQRCFYLDRRLGVNRPAFPSFLINQAVDLLFKKEFDIYREKGEPHPLIKDTDLIPYKHKDLDTWRDAFKGVRYHHEKSNFIVFGGIDDIWTDGDKVYIVDYKATSKPSDTDLAGTLYISYKNQIEIYQWLFRHLDFNVSNTGYFVYANGSFEEDSFNDVIKFNTQLIPYIGDDSWIEDTLLKAKEVLVSDDIPAANTYCDHCKYRDAAGNSFKHHLGK